MDSHGLLDTSVVIDHDRVDSGRLPEASAVSSITIAELTVGPLAARDDEERARRQDRLHWAVATWEPLPFDAPAARAYGRICSTLMARGRAGRRCFAELLIAATAVANGLPLYTRNPKDLVGLERLLVVRKV
jgi:predicted nucleic acid-binding protein